MTWQYRACCTRPFCAARTPTRACCGWRPRREAEGRPGARPPPMPVLARERVRYVGEPVAAVVATRPEMARDALDQLAATYEPLPAVVDPGPDGPAVHAEYPDNVCYRWSETVGDVESAFAQAAHVVRLCVQNNRVAPLALEPRGLLATFDGGGDE